MQVGFPTYSTDLAGLRRSTEKLREEARTVAHATVDGSPADLAGALVRGKEAGRQAAASTAALRREDQALGSVIDVVT
jgi:hypothetical protein